MPINSKKIAINTLMLYVRMLFLMVVTLFTSRVVLDKLGVVDYGIYNAVGGVVAMLGFLNGTLSTGTSRFLTFELGTNNKERLQKTFSTAFYTHLALAITIALLLESAGVWFINNKLIIPPERLPSAIWCFHISVLTTLVAITQVPYTAVIIAHENMKVYAYVGIVEALASLAVAYVLTIVSTDKLILYASLLATIKICISLYYRFYCNLHYQESRLHWIFDRSIFNQLLCFSGWSLIANLAEVLSHQGYILLINMFFSPVVVAAQAVGNQISSAMMAFVGNFRTAINPQIVKLYAAKDYVASRQLTLSSTIYVFDLLLLLGLPLIVLMKPLLSFWLVEVPEYAVVFGQYIVARNILGCFGASFYTPMVASGELRHNSYAAVYVSTFAFILLYFILKYGGSVMWVQYMALISTLVFSLLVKPIILHKRIAYSVKDLLVCILQCFKIAVIPIVVSVLTYSGVNIEGFWMMLMVAALIACSVCISAWIFLDREMKDKIIVFAKKKINKNIIDMWFPS